MHAQGKKKLPNAIKRLGSQFICVSHIRTVGLVAKKRFFDTSDPAVYARRRTIARAPMLRSAAVPGSGMSAIRLG